MRTQATMNGSGPRAATSHGKADKKKHLSDLCLGSRQLVWQLLLLLLLLLLLACPWVYARLAQAVVWQFSFVLMVSQCCFVVSCAACFHKGFCHLSLSRTSPGASWGGSVFLLTGKAFRLPNVDLGGRAWNLHTHRQCVRTHAHDV